MLVLWLLLDQWLVGTQLFFFYIVHLLDCCSMFHPVSLCIGICIRLPLLCRFYGLLVPYGSVDNVMLRLSLLLILRILRSIMHLEVNPLTMSHMDLPCLGLVLLDMVESYRSLVQIISGTDSSIALLWFLLFLIPPGYILLYLSIVFQRRGVCPLVV